MKNVILILAGILAASMLAAGCGKKNSVAPEQKVEATANPDGNGSCENGCGGDADLTDETAKISRT